MNKFLRVVSLVFAVFAGHVTLAQTTNISHPENLKPNYKLRCLSLSELSANYSPADYKGALVACGKQQRIEDASTAFLMMNIYGSYDGQKVNDRSAHQGLQVLMMDAFSQIPKKTGQRIQDFTSSAVREKNAFFVALCSRVHDMGQPTYEPVYLAAHGMGAFVTKNGALKGKSRQTLIAEMSRTSLKAKWATTLAPCQSVLK